MIRLGADGPQEAAILPEAGCYQDHLCISECARMCSFVGLLPAGPLWDKAKAQAVAYLQGGGAGIPNCADGAPVEQRACASMVDYATYVARVLHNLIETALWPALRESEPDTAVTTIDDWLIRLGWDDCFQAFCRGDTLGVSNPFLVQGECGLIPYPVATPPDLALAVKRGIIRALSRLNMGPQRTLAGINWVIEPLGAALAPRNPLPPCDADYPGKPLCASPEFLLCYSGDKIEAVDTDTSLRCNNPKVFIDAFFSPPEGTPPSIPSTIWPGVLAAECIVRSMLTKSAQKTIFRCDF